MKIVNKLQDLISKLPKRDKNALSILAVFVMFCFVYWAGTISLNYKIAAVAKFESVRGAVWWVDSMSDKILTMQKDTMRLKDQSLLELASSDAQGLNITFKRVEPEGEDELRLWVENIRFNAGLMWLHRLNALHKINIQQLQVEPTDVEGYVNLRVTLLRKPAD